MSKYLTDVWKLEAEYTLAWIEGLEKRLLERENLVNNRNI